MNPIITLTTDFGLEDSYVAQMKGVILGIQPAARIIDVTHFVPPQEVSVGALILKDVLQVFPAQTIHVAVVDPGVGSQRRIVAAEIGDQRVIAPDNGLLGFLAGSEHVGQIIELNQARFWRADVSSTFHGRDIMAPVAAYWSAGTDIQECGTVSSVPLQRLSLPAPTQEGQRLLGEVIHVDHFGNLITNITGENLRLYAPESVMVEIAEHRIPRLSRHYSQAGDGELLALIGSSGLMEVSMNCGNAAANLSAGRGARVAVVLP